MAAYHRRQQVCHTRPAYREGRQEKAVKVYTINNESRFLLVQGVPALKLTKEFLDICSLYGAIQEYRLLEDFPDTEEFTQVYWIQYQQLQAAKVAKRKLDDRPFYGGVLHVSYAPEYENVDDTRQKLQDRRKAVAKRLRILEAQQQDHSTKGSSILPGSSMPTTATDMPEEGRKPQSANLEGIPHGAQSEVSHGTWAEQPSDNRTNISSQASQSDDTIEQAGISSLQLPLPPRVLPRYDWSKPAQPSPEFPRISTSHATLPAGFNPYLDGKAPTDPYQLTKTASELHPKEIGPYLPASCNLNSTRQGIALRDDSGGAQLQITDSQGNQSDLDTKRLARKRQSSDISQTGPQQTLDLNIGRPIKKKRALERCSAPRTHQPSRIVQNTPRNAGVDSVKGPGFMPRQVKAQKRQGDAVQGSEQAAASNNEANQESSPSTGDVSLDQTVQHIRSRLKAVTEASARVSQPSSAPSTASDAVAAQQVEQQDVPQQRQRPRKTTRRKI